MKENERRNDMITEQDALKAYNLLMDYCGGRESCEGCLFEMEEGAPGVCVMETQDIPDGWQQLELG